MAGPLRPQPALGLAWSDLAAVHDPGGLLMFPVAGDKLGVAWVFIAPKSAMPPAAVLAAEKYFKAKGYLATNAQHSSASLTVLDPPAAGRAAGARVLFVAANCYGVANSRAAAEAIVGTSAAQSLAGEANFKRLMTTSGGDKPAATGDVSFYLRPFDLWERSRAAGGPAKEKPPAANAAASKTSASKQAKAAKSKSPDEAKSAGKSKAGGAKSGAKPKRAKQEPEDELAAARASDWTVCTRSGAWWSLTGRNPANGKSVPRSWRRDRTVASCDWWPSKRASSTRHPSGSAPTR